MHAGFRDHATEAEPFLVSQQHADDIELGATQAVSPNDAGEGSGDGFVKINASPRRHLNSRRFSGGSNHEDGARLFGRRRWLHFLSPPGKTTPGKPRGCLEINASRRTGIVRPACCVLGYFLMFVGALQCLALVLGLVAAFFPDQIEMLYQSTSGRSGQSHWPTDFTADILPVRCHSHNDYWRKVPVFSALEAGCTGVEADVWLHDDELFVGHTESSLTANRTFNKLYVNPLTDLLDKQNPISEFQPVLRTPRNGVFDTNAEQTLILLIDFKTNGDTLWSLVHEHLEPLRARSYLTHFNGSSVIRGPITVVATGNAPFHKVVANMTYRDMFFDAPLPELAKLAPKDEKPNPSPSSTIYDPTDEQAYLTKVAGHLQSGADPAETDTTNKGQGYSGVMPDSPRIYTPFNSYYASASLEASLGSPFPYFSAKQRQQIKEHINGAHVQGLQVRYWGVPSWPVSWRHYLWRELIHMGIDYLNIDDLLDATKGDWLSKGSIGRLIWGSAGW